MLEKIKIDEYITQNYETVKADETLGKALGKFEKGVEVLLVFHDKKGYIGVVTKRDIVRSRLDPRRYKIESVYRHAPKLKKDDNVFRVVTLFLENDVQYLPVFENSKILGVVSIDSLLRRLINSSIANLSAKDVMSKDVITVNENEAIGRIIRIMKDQNISRLPIVDSKNKVVGIVTAHDIVMYVVHPRDRMKWGEIVGEKIHPLREPIKHIMTKELITASPDSKLKEIIQKMLDYGITGIIIIDKRGYLQGIVTKKDILEKVKSLEEKREARVNLIFSKGEEIEMIDEIDMDTMKKDILHFFEKHKSLLEDCKDIYIYIKRHKEKFRGLYLYHVRIRIPSKKGVFLSTAENWGLEYAIHLALRKIEKQLEKEKTLELKEREQEEIFESYLEEITML